MAAVLLAAALHGCGGTADEHLSAATPKHTPHDRSVLGALSTPAADPGGVLTAFESEETLLLLPDGQSALLDGVIPEPMGQTWPGVGNDPGSLLIQYQGGDASQREAVIVEDPIDPTNHVLAFHLRDANVPAVEGDVPRGRIQMNAYDGTFLRAREIRFSVRLFVASDISLLRSLQGTFDWLTVAEWWNDAAWLGMPFPFRVSINVVKPAPRRGSPLHFQARAQTMDVDSDQWSRTVWQITNRSVQVPTGRWVTLEYAYLEGNASTGRFYMAMTPDGGARTVLFDVRSWTHHPDDPAPDGLTHVNPLKLYTSKQVIDHVRNAGGTLSVYWDDLSFRLCRDRQPEESSPCAPASFGS